MANKLPQGNFSGNSGPNDFQCFGPPAMNDAGRDCQSHPFQHLPRSVRSVDSGRVDPRSHRGMRRRITPEYRHIEYLIRKARERNDGVAVKALHKQQRQTPSVDFKTRTTPGFATPATPTTSCSGSSGPRRRLGDQVQAPGLAEDNFKLELSEEKTRVTHTRTEAARFLGYEVSVMWSESRPTVNGNIKLAIPEVKVQGACSRYTGAGNATRMFTQDATTGEWNDWKAG